MNKLIIIILLILFTLNLRSQDLSAGLRIGDNTSNLKGDYGFTRDYINYMSINKFYFGIFIKYKLQNNIYIQPEINYKSKGFEYVSDGWNGASWGGNANINYIEVPIQINYSYGKKFKIFVNCGPSINFLISGGEYNYTTWSSADGIRNYYSRNIKSDFNSVMLGMKSGVGVNYEISTKTVIFTELGLSYDLTKSTKEKEIIDLNTGDTWYYNNTHFLDLSISLGISYKLEI